MNTRTPFPVAINMKKKEMKKMSEKGHDSRASRADRESFAEEKGFKLKEPKEAKKGVLNSRTLPPNIREALEELGFEFAEEGGSYILPIGSPEPAGRDDQDDEADK
jgi:hypothetical protein